jgi:hypothetical protein
MILQILHNQEMVAELKIVWEDVTRSMVTQETCPHDAKVRMPGYDGMYECTRCHKFIHTVDLAASKEKEITDDKVPKYKENGWEDDDLD